MMLVGFWLMFAVVFMGCGAIEIVDASYSPRVAIVIIFAAVMWPLGLPIYLTGALLKNDWKWWQ